MGSLRPAASGAGGRRPATDLVEPLADDRRLAEQVREAVLREHATELRFEIVFAGDWSGWQ